MKSRIVLFFFFINLLTLVSSCKKYEQVGAGDWSHVLRFNQAEIVSNDMFKLFLYTVLAAEDSILQPNDSNSFRIPDPGFNIAISPLDSFSFPKTYTLTFPSQGIICFDGVFRKGSVQIEADTFLMVQNSHFKVSENVNIHGILNNSSKDYTISLVGTIPQLFQANSASEQSSVHGTFTYTASHSYQWLLGYSSHKTLTDDFFISFGSADFTDFSASITDGLQFVNYCFWIGSGAAEIIPQGYPLRHLTYSDSCLNQAKVVVNNEVFPIVF